MALRVLSAIAERFGTPRWGATLVVALVATYLAFAATAPIVDPDVWWVAAAGRETLSTLRAPTQNVFSFVDPAERWIMHEWLLGPLFAAGLRALGPAFFAGLAVASAALVLGLLVPAILRDARRPAAGYALALLALGTFGFRLLTARPSAIALVFPIALFRVATARPFGVRRAALAAAILLVWTNAHGSFPLGVAMLVAAAVAADPAERRARAVTAAVGAGATLVNPYGLDLHRFVYAYFRGDDGIHAFIRQAIVEFSPIWRAPLDVLGVTERVGLAAVVVLSGYALSRPAHRARGLAALTLVAFAAKNVRHVELSGLLACLLLAPAAGDALARVAPEGSPPRWATTAPAWAACIALVVWGVMVRARPPLEWITPRIRPAATLVERLPDGANAFVSFHASGMAIWLGHPRGIRVFADPRNDCYRVETARAFHELAVTQVPRPRVAELLDPPGTTHVLVPEAHPLAHSLAQTPSWYPLATYQGWIAFARAGHESH